MVWYLDLIVIAAYSSLFIWVILKKGWIFHDIKKIIYDWLQFTKQRYVIITLLPAIILMTILFSINLGGSEVYHIRPYGFDTMYLTYIPYDMIVNTHLDPLHKGYPGLTFYIQLPFIIIPSILHVSDISSFSTIMVVTRIISATCFLGTTVVIGRTSFLLFKEKKRSVLAMLLFSLFPLTTNVTNYWGRISHTLLTLNSSLVLYYAVYTVLNKNKYESAGFQGLWLSFLFAGLTMGTKYDGAAVLIAPILAVIFTFGLGTNVEQLKESFKGFNSESLTAFIKELKNNESLRILSKGLLIFLFTFLLTTPFWLLLPHKYVGGLLRIIQETGGQLSAATTLQGKFNVFVNNLSRDATVLFVVYIFIIQIPLFFLTYYLYHKQRKNAVQNYSDDFSNRLLSMFLVVAVLVIYSLPYASGILYPQLRHLCQLLFPMAIIGSFNVFLPVNKLKNVSTNAFVKINHFLSLFLLFTVVFSSLIFAATVIQISEDTTFDDCADWISENIHKDAKIAISAYVMVPETHTNIVDLGFIQIIYPNQEVNFVGIDYFVIEANSLGNELYSWLLNSTEYVEIIRFTADGGSLDILGSGESGPFELFLNFIQTGRFHEGKHGHDIVIFSNAS